jgi:hypothetical protein
LELYLGSRRSDLAVRVSVLAVFDPRVRAWRRGRSRLPANKVWEVDLLLMLTFREVEPPLAGHGSEGEA